MDRPEFCRTRLEDAVVSGDFPRKILHGSHVDISLEIETEHK